MIHHSDHVQSIVLDISDRTAVTTEGDRKTKVLANGKGCGEPSGVFVCSPERNGLGAELYAPEGEDLITRDMIHVPKCHGTEVVHIGRGVTGGLEYLRTVDIESLVIVSRIENDSD